MKQAGFLHGKLYHVAQNGVEHAMVGSSNFTSRGLGVSQQSNIELNLEADSRRDVRSSARKARLTATSGGRRLGKTQPTIGLPGIRSLALSAPGGVAPERRALVLGLPPGGGVGSLPRAEAVGTTASTPAPRPFRKFISVFALNRCYLCRDSSFSLGRSGIVRRTCFMGVVNSPASVWCSGRSNSSRPN